MSPPASPVQEKRKRKYKRSPSARRTAGSSVSRDVPPRPSNCFILFRRDYLEKHPATIDRTPQAIGNAWTSLSYSQQSKWHEQAQKAKEEHARMYPEYVYRPNRSQPKKRRKRNARVEPVNEYPGHPGPVPPLSSSMDYPSDLKRLRESLGLPHWDDSVLVSVDEGSRFDGQLHGVPESLLRRASSAPAPVGGSPGQSTSTSTNPTPPDFNSSGVHSAFAQRHSYSGVRPGFIPTDLFLPTLPLHLFRDDAVVPLSMPFARQDEGDYLQLLQGYQLPETNGPQATKVESSADSLNTVPTADELPSLYPVKHQQGLHQLHGVVHPPQPSSLEHLPQPVHHSGTIPFPTGGLDGGALPHIRHHAYDEGSWRPYSPVDLDWFPEHGNEPVGLPVSGPSAAGPSSYPPPYLPLTTTDEELYPYPVFS